MGSFKYCQRLLKSQHVKPVVIKKDERNQLKTNNSTLNFYKT